MPGSWISIRIRSGCASCASVTPASAFVALSTVCPAVSNRNVASFMLAGLSSTIRTVAMSGHHGVLSGLGSGAPGHRPPNLGDEPIAVEVRLFHHRHDEPVELRAVLGSDMLGGDNENWYTCSVGIRMQRRHHVETVYLGHHEIEHDKIRQLAPGRVDRFPPSIRSQYGTGQAQQPYRDQLHCLGIVIDDQDLERLAFRERKEAELHEQLSQLLPRDGLLHDPGGAEREAPTVVRDDRDD